MRLRSDTRFVQHPLDGGRRKQKTKQACSGMPAKSKPPFSLAFREKIRFAFFEFVFILYQLRVMFHDQSIKFPRGHSGGFYLFTYFLFPNRGTTLFAQIVRLMLHPDDHALCSCNGGCRRSHIQWGFSRNRPPDRSLKHILNGIYVGDKTNDTEDNHENHGVYDDQPC